MVDIEEPSIPSGPSDSADSSKQPTITNMAGWLEMDEDIDFEPEPISFGLQEIEID